MGAGGSVSWTSPYLSLLKSNDSPLSSPITASQASWIGSLLAIGALVGSFLFGWMSEKFGRFPSLITAAVPQIVSWLNFYLPSDTKIFFKTWWLIIIFSSSAKWLYLGRFLAGLSTGGCFALVPMYIAEISQDNVRGSLGSFFCLSINFGMLLVYIAGKFLSYTLTPKVMLLAPVSFLVFFFFCTETPVYLLRHGKVDKSSKALIFLRTCDANGETQDEVDAELQRMIRKVNNDSLVEQKSALSALSE